MVTQKELEQRLKPLIKELRKHPYVKAIRKEFGYRWYKIPYYWLISNKPNWLKFTIRCGEFYHGMEYQKCYNRDNWLIRLLRKSRKIRIWMTKNEIRWEGCT